MAQLPLQVACGPLAGSRDVHGCLYLSPCPSVFFCVVESVRPVPCFFNIKSVCPSYKH